MFKKKMGRPPAAWMFDIAIGQTWDDKEFLTYSDLKNEYNLSDRSLSKFFDRIELEPVYQKIEGSVQRVINPIELKKLASRYVADYPKPE